MMTPQEVANCTFAKSMVGGYNMASVDDFLDKLTEDYAGLYKENAALKAKLKVTVDKLAEYREMEGAMSSTLLTAQKMATSILAEAEVKRDAIVAEAEAAAQARRAKAEAEVSAQEQRIADVRARVDRGLEAERVRLSVGQEKLRAFIRDVTSVCNEQLALLDLLPELPAAEEPAPAVVLPQREKAVQAEPEEAEEAVPAFSAAPPEEEPEEQEDPFAGGLDGMDGEEEDLRDTRILNLDDLQFGRNYVRE